MEEEGNGEKITGISFECLHRQQLYVMNIVKEIGYTSEGDVDSVFSSRL